MELDQLLKVTVRLVGARGNFEDHPRAFNLPEQLASLGIWVCVREFIGDYFAHLRAKNVIKKLQGGFLMGGVGGNAEIVDELGLSGADLPTAGAIDDDDDPNDERDDENEAPVREVRDTMEAPEEFKVDDEDRA